MKIIRVYQLNGEKLPKDVLENDFIQQAKELMFMLEKSNKADIMLECQKRNAIRQHRINFKLTMFLNL
jgi:hypothetical protein